MSSSKKGKGKASSSSTKPSNKDEAMRLLPNKAQRVRFVKYFQKKPILPPRFAVLDNFYSECFSFPALFKSQGIANLIECREDVYPDLVRIFYSNMEIVDGNIVSNVKGKAISMSVKLFGEILGIPSEGVGMRLNVASTLVGYNKREFYYGIARIPEHEFIQKRQRIVGGPPERNSWSAGILFIDDRLIHYMLAYIIMPKFSNFSTINDCEMQVLFAMKNNRQINWAYVILNHLVTHNECASSLPYGHWLTLVFKHFNVDLSGELVYEIDSSRDEITPRKVCNTKTGVKFDPIQRTITYITQSQNQDQAPNVEVTNEQVYDYMHYVNHNINCQFAHQNTHLNIPPYEIQPYHYPFLQPQDNEDNNDQDDQNDFMNQDD